jgi:hypothetical protein
MKTMNMKTMKKYFLLFFGVYIIFIALLLLHCFYCIVAFIDFVTCHISAALGQKRLYFFFAMIFLGADATNAAGAVTVDV